MADTIITPNEEGTKDNVPAPVTQEQIEALKSIVAEQAKTIASLQVKETVITTKAAAKIEVPSKLVEHDGKKYKWAVAHFKHGAAVITAEDAATDETLIGELIAIEGQGILTELF